MKKFCKILKPDTSVVACIFNPKTKDVIPNLSYNIDGGHNNEAATNEPIDQVINDFHALAEFFAEFSKFNLLL